MSIPSFKVPAPHVLAELLLVGLAALVVASLGALADAYPVESYFYLAKARSLAEGHLLHVGWGDGVDRRFFWGYSIALAPLIRVLGDASFWLLAAALQAWTGFVLARVFRMLPLEKPAQLGALALALFSPVVLRWSTVPMAEPLLLAFAANAAFFALRYRAGASRRELLWAAAMSGAALLTRVEGLFVVVGAVALCGPRMIREKSRVTAAACAALALGPELLHASYLAFYALPSSALAASVDAARTAHEAPVLDGFFAIARAPFWPAFLFGGEPWLYARHFPALLTGLQGLVLALYTLAVVGALATGFFRRGFAFACAAVLLSYCLSHAALFHADERFGYAAAPLAALLFAWGAQKTFAWAGEPGRARAVLGVCLAAAAVSGVYGVRTAQMQAEQLRAEASGRDVKAVAKAAREVLASGRTVVTDLGPAFAYYLGAHVYFDRAAPDLYEDQVPSGEAGRVFLDRHHVGLIVATRTPREVIAEFALAPGEFRELGTPGATLIDLEAAGSERAAK